MTKEDILKGLKEVFTIIKPKLNLDSVTYDARLIEDLGVDSLTMLLLSLATEQKFDIRFDDSAQFETVGQVCDYILATANKA